ncbi:trans-sialidase [Trypanosoma cruzi]|nr:trans-sialidase [Trypanosoma cruzi]
MSRIPRVASGVDGSNGATPNHSRNGSLLLLTKGERTEFIASGGAGVLMEDGTLVFPLMAVDEAEDVYSMIVHSTDYGSTWSLAVDMSSAECFYPRVTEWKESLLMIVDCENGERV